MFRMCCWSREPLPLWLSFLVCHSTLPMRSPSGSMADTQFHGCSIRKLRAYSSSLSPRAFYSFFSFNVYSVPTTYSIDLLGLQSSVPSIILSIIGEATALSVQQTQSTASTASLASALSILNSLSVLSDLSLSSLAAAATSAVGSITSDVGSITSDVGKIVRISLCFFFTSFH